MPRCLGQRNGDNVTHQSGTDCRGMPSIHSRSAHASQGCCKDHPCRLALHLEGCHPMCVMPVEQVSIHYACSPIRQPQPMNMALPSHFDTLWTRDVVNCSARLLWPSDKSKHSCARKPSTVCPSIPILYNCHRSQEPLSERRTQLACCATQHSSTHHVQ